MQRKHSFYLALTQYISDVFDGSAPRRVWDAGVKTAAQASERDCMMHTVTFLRDIMLSKHIFYVLASRS